MRTATAFHRRRARAALLLTPVAMVLVLAGAWAGVETVRPEVIDPDYHMRRDLLRTRIAENPGRPVAVVIGSSRMAMGFEPESLPNPAYPVLWFNAAHHGSGPVMNGVILSRLLDDGIRPDFVVLEVMPALYVSENDMFLARLLTYRDLTRIHRHTPPGELDFCYIRDRLKRFRHMSRVTNPFESLTPPLPFGGPVIPFMEVSPSDRVARIAVQREAFGWAARSMEVRPAANRALRDSLALCRERGITPVLLRSPEGPVFRSFYDPSALERFEDYIAGVAADHSVRVIDARGWLSEEDFLDSHHPLRRGAVAFTKRLSAECELQGQ
jgi:hypothetical protein